jgi:hypothetical protein
MNLLSEQIPTVAIDQKEDTASSQVFLFSGHMVDALNRSPPRFPSDKEPLAAAAIGQLLDELGAGAMMRRFLAALAATIYSLSNPVCSADYSTSSIPQRRRMFASVFGSIAAGILSVAPRHGSAEIETLRAHDSIDFLVGPVHAITEIRGSARA